MNDLVQEYEEIIVPKTTFKDVVMGSDIGKTLLKLIDIYPEQADNIDRYGKVLEYLLSTEPSSNEESMYLIIRHVHDSCQWCDDRKTKGMELCASCTQEKSENYYDVSGYKNDGSGTHYGIEFSPWDQWLSFYIEDEALTKFSKEEIVVRAMWEMTFVGFNPEDIKAQMDSLIQMTKDIENGTMKTYSWDEVKARLDSLFDDEEEKE